MGDRKQPSASPPKLVGKNSVISFYENKYTDGKFDLVVRDQPNLSEMCVQIVKRSNGEVIPYDEPIFILRGRDHLAIDLLEQYYALCNDDGCTDYQLNAINQSGDRTLP
jgi:hypothetical protein